MDLLWSHLGSHLCVSGHSQRRRLGSKQNLSAPPKHPSNTLTLFLLHGVRVGLPGRRKWKTSGDLLWWCLPGTALNMQTHTEHYSIPYAFKYQQPWREQWPGTGRRVGVDPNWDFQIIFSNADHSQKHSRLKRSVNINYGCAGSCGVLKYVGMFLIHPAIGEYDWRCRILF